ncbi:ABC transporter substrate-binding protein [Euzebya tangerina]|uniref:ABC transporter substrate-binding protein n=1 Tax=Euzebya tangerina TaxID=591198 RepID=UPI0013C2EC7C|nr:ABC transporter substrate-binding protein [Euzebya tangerina]
MRPRRVLLILGLVLLLVACDPDGPDVPLGPTVAPGVTSVEQSGGSFRYGIGPPRAITPTLAQSGDDLAVVDALFDSLTAWDARGRAVPSAASSWEVSDDATEWTFTLRPGSTFSDGAPVTAEAFRTAWSTLSAGGPFGYLLADVIGHGAVARGEVPVLSGVRIDDEFTLTVLLRRPRSDLAAVVGHPALGPTNLTQRAADPVSWVQQPAGNGPFAVTEPYTDADFIRASAVDTWANGLRVAGSPTEVVFRIGDLDINYLAFTQGRRDLTAVPPEALAVAAEDFPSRGGAWSGPGLIVGGRPESYVLGVNTQTPPYDQVDVRQAISLALDREALADSLQNGNLAPATSLLPPALPGTQIDQCDRCTLDIPAARRLLQEAGVQQLGFAFNAGGGHEAVRDELRGGLSRAGVALVSNGRGPAPPLPEYQDQLLAGTVGIFRFPLVADVPSSLSVLFPLLHSTQVPERGGMNYMRYTNATVDSLLEQAARTLDDESRESLLDRVVDRAVNVDQVVMPVFSTQHSMVASAEIRGLRYDPHGLVNLTELVIQR